MSTPLFEASMRRRSSLRRVRSIEELRPSVAAPLPANVRIFGIDPGSLITGYAVVDCDSRQTRYVASGSIRTAELEFTNRLTEIFNALNRLVQEFKPDEVAIERVFVHRNADSALKLGQARGAALSATFFAQPRIFEYAPREVKLAVVGTGTAQKEQVLLMVKRLLKLSGEMGHDAADAVAIALCHAHSRRLRSLVDAQRSRR